MTTTEKFFVECVKCGIKEENISALPNGLDYQQLYILCKRHSMSVVVFSALKNLKEQLPFEFYSALQNSTHRYIVADTQSEYDKKTFFDAMENNGLKYMPLKGYHLKKLYPNTAMRYASDCDVLIDISQIKQIRALVDKLGLKTKRHDEHHDIVYFPYSKTIFELHKTVFVGPLEKYFLNIFERACLKEGTEFFYKMSPEDFYISILAHSAYHFAEDAGVGIRHITDIYLYKKSYNLDYDFLDVQLNRCGLLKFKDRFEAIADYFFEDKVVNDDIKLLANYIIKSSLFGCDGKKSVSDVVSNLQKSGNKNYKLLTIFKSIFPEKDKMQFSYPILKRVVLLLPIFYVIRWFDVLIKRPKNIAKLKEYSNVNSDDFKEIKSIRTLLGIEKL